jgi:hypothetical protein
MHNKQLWVEDPSNVKPLEFRPIVRADMNRWEKEGVEISELQQILDTASQVQHYEDVLLHRFCKDNVEIDNEHGYIEVRLRPLIQMRPHIRYLLVSRMIRFVAQKKTHMTASKLDELVQTLLRYEGREKHVTIGGCLLSVNQSKLVITRTRSAMAIRAEVSVTTRFNTQVVYQDVQKIKVKQWIGRDINELPSRNALKVLYDNPYGGGQLDTDPDATLVIRTITKVDLQFIACKFLFLSY